ncbi:MAG: GDP-mannose-dependent alpha-(1-6)-phosphatidylinositol monomannoside mannosyltransferase [Haliscomenobacter sp.]|nr:GDP-mannose-dependent alpha-(1-6)-phosphatidylinositol monomannoside mannosyltransferase [Haliscomenobacter sp.]
MDLLLVTTEFPPQPGGIGHHACNLARYLNLQQVIAEVVCESRDERNFSGECAFDQTMVFRVHRIPRKRSAVLRFGWRAWKILQLTQKTNIILMASGLWPLLLIGFFKVLGLRQQRTIYIAHAVDVNPSNKWLKKLCHFLLSRFDRIVSVSAYTSEKLPLHLREKTTVIPNGFDLERFNVKQKTEVLVQGQPNLVTLGSVTSRKGQINIVNALPEIINAYPRVQYHMIGLPIEKDQVLARAKLLGVEDHIYFHGALDDEEMIQRLWQADVFMMLSNHTPDGDFEGFGIAIMEAAYLGVPAIGAKGTGIEDAIAHGKSGLLVDPHKHDEIKAALDQIVANISYYKEQAKAHASTFTWEMVTPRYIAVIASLANKSKT